jgi:hypothetical protein
MKTEEGVIRSRYVTAQPFSRHHRAFDPNIVFDRVQIILDDGPFRLHNKFEHGQK